MKKIYFLLLLCNLQNTLFCSNLNDDNQQTSHSRTNNNRPIDDSFISNANTITNLHKKLVSFTNLNIYREETNKEPHKQLRLGIDLLENILNLISNNKQILDDKEFITHDNLLQKKNSITSRLKTTTLQIAEAFEILDVFENNVTYFLKSINFKPHENIHRQPKPKDNALMNLDYLQQELAYYIELKNNLKTKNIDENPNITEAIKLLQATIEDINTTDKLEQQSKKSLESLEFLSDILHAFQNVEQELAKDQAILKDKKSLRLMQMATQPPQKISTQNQNIFNQNQKPEVKDGTFHPSKIIVHPDTLMLYVPVTDQQPAIHVLHHKLTDNARMNSNNINTNNNQPATHVVPPQLTDTDNMNISDIDNDDNSDIISRAQQHNTDYNARPSASAPEES